MTTFPEQDVRTGFHPVRWLLLALAAVLFALAWPLGVIWGCLTWLGAALAEGFTTGRDTVGGGS